MLFSSTRAADKCIDFLHTHGSDHQATDTHKMLLVPAVTRILDPQLLWTVSLTVLFYPSSLSKLAKTFWQHTGEGVSSRKAEYMHKLYDEGLVVGDHVLNKASIPCKGPKRYQKLDSVQPLIASSPSLPGQEATDGEQIKFIEERFGRNLNLGLANVAKIAIRRRIAGSLTANVELEQVENMSHAARRASDLPGFSEHDVYLYSGGMCSIFNAHQTLLAARGHHKSICFGYRHCPHTS